MGRQRDISPLPTSIFSPISYGGSRSVRGMLLRSRHKDEWAAASTNTLNSLDGGDNAAGILGSCHATTVNHIRSCVDELPAVPDSFNSDGALRELLGSSVGYATDECKTAPYDEALCAWPPAGATPVDLTTRLPEADGSLLLEKESKMLRPAAEASALKESCSVNASFSDPALVRRPHIYGFVLSLLIDAGMAELKARDSVNTVGVFSVLKKNGTLRIITDTRMVNMYFVDPHHTDPTA